MTCCPQLEEPQLENLYFIGLFELLCIHFVKGSISHKLNVNWYDLCLSLEHGLLSCPKLFVMWMEVWILWLVNWLYRILRLLWYLVHFLVTLCVSYAFFMHMVPLQFVMQYKSTSGQSDTRWWHSNDRSGNCVTSWHGGNSMCYDKTGPWKIVSVSSRLS